MTTPDPLAAVKARRSADCTGIDVPPGWVPLMTELDAALVTVTPDIRYEQIKAKYAELRVYVSGRNDAARDLIAAAEIASRNICESCGAAGTTYQSPHGWYRALCADHAAADGYTVVANP